VANLKNRNSPKLGRLIAANRRRFGGHILVAAPHPMRHIKFSVSKTV
jgi:hypothetical protein